MAKEAARKVWNRPQLKHLGKIKDVAGAQTPNAQSGGAKS